ncbi:50S ribosomal protein L10 [Erysipelothrix urinaevulpis]|uniref:50S ribosomal protein L10 n=1 Tax=Erysipelothrix urinaevulpis TaxID=2683717 RepID=UPI001915580E|nr:50S ribosomal protein L10 [Erysipelothrix urinaevulpis]
MEVNHLRNEVLEAKQDLVAEIQKEVLGSESAVIVEYHGLNVGQITELRAKLHGAGVNFKVYKNTLFRRAVEGTDFEALTEDLVGPNAVAFGGDAVAPSRVLAEFAKKNKKLQIKTGFVDGEIVSIDEIKELATLPDHDGMVSMFLSVLQAPVRNLAYALSQVSEKKEAGDVVEAKEEVVEEPAVEETVAQEA